MFVLSLQPTISGSVTTACHIPRLWMEEWPPIWKAAAIILNRESRTADKGCYSSLGFGRGANNA